MAANEAWFLWVLLIISNPYLFLNFLKTCVLHFLKTKNCVLNCRVTQKRIFYIFVRWCIIFSQIKKNISIFTVLIFFDLISLYYPPLAAELMFRKKRKVTHWLRVHVLCKRILLILLSYWLWFLILLIVSFLFIFDKFHRNSI